MAYTPDVFADGPEGGTPITAAKLNKLGLALAAADAVAAEAAAVAAEKADAAEVAAAFAQTASAAELEAGLAVKADDAAVSAALAAKADAAATTAALAAKADAAALAAGLAGKADATALAAKADQAAVDAALAAKANAADVTSALALKSNAATVTASLAAKADLVDGKVPVGQIPSGTYASAADAVLTGKTRVEKFGALNHVPTKRQPFGANITFDGSLLTADLEGGGGNKTADLTAVTFRGGFSGEAGFGVVDPTFLFGANDFIVSGTTAGDLAGISSIFGRLTEVHVKTPSVTIPGEVIAGGSEANLGTEATGTTVNNLTSHRVRGPVVKAGTATTAIGLRVTAPSVQGAGVITTAWSIYADDGGGVFLGGAVTMNTGVTVKGAASNAKFECAAPNAQGAAAGSYVGSASGNHGMTFAQGTHTARIDLDTDVLRILKAGSASRFEVNLTSGDVAIKNAAANLTMAGGGDGGGDGVIALGNRAVAPTTNPTSGGVLYADAGALKWRGSSGTVTTLAVA